MRLGLALRTLFRILGDAVFAEKIQHQLTAGAEEAPKPTRSPALTFLATLQREARFVDFLEEKIDGYSDAQVGAAVRDIHRDCASVVGRVFALEPLRTEDEDSQVTVPQGFDPAQTRLTGNVTGTPPHTGVLRHAGWRAARCEVPEWSGSDDAALVVAPAEIELP